jgi:hypothetical protein
MNNLLQKLMFWRQDDEPNSPAAVPEQRPNDSFAPTPETQDQEEAAAVRREDVDEHFHTVGEQDDSPRSDSDV